MTTLHHRPSLATASHTEQAFFLLRTTFVVARNLVPCPARAELALGPTGSG